MIWLLVIVFTILTTELACRLSIENKVLKMSELAKKTTQVLRAKNISDHWKETAMRAYSCATFSATFQLALMIVLLVGTFSAFVVLSNVFVSGLTEAVLQWPVVCVSILVATLYLVARRKIFHG